MIDIERVEAINNIVSQNNEISMQYLFGKIKFVMRFIYDFSEIAKTLQEMIKNDAKFKWTKEKKYSFLKIQEGIA